MPVNNDYSIAGSLPFSNAGANFDFSGNPAALGTNYANTYNAALNLNSANYNNILGGYGQTIQNQLGAQNAINQNYNTLGSQVQGLLAGTDAAQMQRVQDQYAAARGNAWQGAIDRGLGNTTVLDSLTRGVDLDKAKAQTEVQNQFAQLMANYATNIGMAGLNQQNTNMLANTAQANRQLDWMNSISAPYPNPALYAALAQQAGQGNAGLANQARFQDELGKLAAAGNRGSGMTGLNSGGGGGAAQSAFGPPMGPSYTTPTVGYGSIGGGYSAPAGGPSAISIPNMSGGFGSYAAGGGSIAGTPSAFTGGTGSSGMGGGFGSYGGYDPLAYGGGGDWGSDAGTGYADAGTGYTWGDDGYLYADDSAYSDAGSYDAYGYGSDNGYVTYDPSQDYGGYSWGDDGYMYYE